MRGFILSISIFLPFVAQAAEAPLNIPLTRGIRESGMTFTDSSGHFRFGVRPNIIATPRATLSLGEEFDKTIPLNNETLRSTLYTYTLNAEKGKLTLHGAMWISLDWEKRAANVTLQYWSEEDARWIELPTSFDKKNRRLQASLSLTHATIGVFKKNSKLAGKASWYDWHGAAMNAFPIGTEVLVTNPKNGKQAKTRVVSTGPYMPGRIIDLPRDIFAKIGDLWDGVMDVTVQPIHITANPPTNAQ